MSTIVLTNENALWVENDDRRTVFLDVSPAWKGDMKYFGKLGTAMKYIRVGEVFYAYLQAIAEAYPEFNGNPPPITASKQEHIVSTLPHYFNLWKKNVFQVLVCLNRIYRSRSFMINMQNIVKAKGLNFLL